jgi:hypothetical protein
MFGFVKPGPTRLTSTLKPLRLEISILHWRLEKQHDWQSTISKVS